MNSDRVSFRVHEDSTISCLACSERGGRVRAIPAQRFSFADDEVARSLQRALRPIHADWLELAAAIHFVDRLLLRGTSIGRDSSAAWSRAVHLVVPVRETQMWERAGVKELLRDILFFTTDDDWEIEFVSRQTLRASESQQYLFNSPLPNDAEVALFSGGLDSYAGAAIRRHEKPDAPFVFVSGCTHGWQLGWQREQFESLRHGRDDRARHVTVAYGLIDNDAKNACESTQRSRGFLYLSMGCVTALVAGARALHVYENGIGAINLPYNGGQIGALNTRAVNPRTLLKMGQLASLLTGEPFSVINPFLFKTKAEMCAHPALDAHIDDIKKTFSCDSFPIRLSTGGSQCGCCTSCLLRRMALDLAGRGAHDPAGGYLVDLLGAVHSPANSLLNFRRMDGQARAFHRLLSSETPWPELTPVFPMLAHIATELRITGLCGDGERQLTDLYRRYTAEWKTFAERHPFSGQEAAA